MQQYNLKKIFFTVFSALTVVACAMPINKVEARGEGAVVLAAGVGALLGAAVASDVQHRHHHRQAYRSHQYVTMQQRTMNYVLMNYNPAFHDCWVRYVIVDCARVLNPVQQEQLIGVMNQRRNEMGINVPVGSRVIESRSIYSY